MVSRKIAQDKSKKNLVLDELGLFIDKKVILSKEKVTPISGLSIYKWTLY
jgi:hypothetical protein